MKCRSFLTRWGVSGFLALAFTFASFHSAHAQGTAFTYQGRLNLNSSAASGDYDMQFKLRPDANSTNQIGAAIVVAPVGVTNGLFLVTLDFSNVFDGNPLFLEIGIRPNGSSSNYTILSPAQPLTSTPYAVRAITSSTFTGAIADFQLSTNIPRFTTGGGFTGLVVLSNASGNFNGTLSGTFSGAATGTFNGAATGTFNGTTTGTNIGTFVGDGGAVTNVNVTNLTGLVQSNPNWQLLQSSPQQAAAGNNYVSTNNTNLTLTLPSNPGIGTLLRISGSGAGGWKLGQNAGQSIVTVNLGLPAGQSFVTTSNSQAWKSVASSANGMNLIAAYGIGNIYYSHDGGFSWAKSDATNTLNWVGVASSANGLRMVAVANGNRVATSINGGVNWTLQTPSPAAAWGCVASSADGIKLVAAVPASSVYTSTNGGTNWTAHTVTASEPSWASVASSTDGTKLFAVGGGSTPVWMSTDSGNTWTNHGPGIGWTGIACSADGTKVVATANNGNIYTSGDSGLNWIPRASSQSWKCVTSSTDGVNLAAAYSLGYIYTSSDSGQTWLQRTNYAPAGAQAWNTIASSSNGSRLAAAISTGNIYTSIATTTVGTSGSLLGTQFSSVELQYIGNGQWMPLSLTGSFISN